MAQEEPVVDAAAAAAGANVQTPNPERSSREFGGVSDKKRWMAYSLHGRAAAVKAMGLPRCMHTDNTSRQNMWCVMVKLALANVSIGNFWIHSWPQLRWDIK